MHSRNDVGVAWRALALCPLLCVAGISSAATNVWDGDGPTGNWATNANWVGDTAFATSNDVAFYAVSTNLTTTLGADRAIASLLFNSDADSNVFISGNVLMTMGDITVDQDAAGQHYISSQITVSNNQSWAINSTNGGTLMVGAVRQAGNRPLTTLTKTGDGVLFLTNSGLQASNFVIQSGIVRYVGSANAFDDNTTVVVVQSNGILDKANVGGVDAFRGLAGSGVVTNWNSELQLRPQFSDNSVFRGTIYQGAGTGTLTITLDANGASTTFDRSTNAIQAFDTAVPFEGRIAVSSQVLSFTGENGSYTNSTALHQIGRYDRATRLGTLLLDSSVSNHINNDRINDNANFVLNVGSQIKIVGNGYTNTTEALGNITNSEGRAIITVDAGSGGSTVLTAKSFTNSNLGRAALVRGDNLGAADAPGVGQFKLLTAPRLSHAGSGDQIGIVPFMSGDTNADGLGSGLVTYDATTGIRPLLASEYTNTFAADRNVRLSANDSIAGNTDIRALHIEGDGTTANLNGNNLRVDSQAIFVGGNSTLQGGTITFGTNTTGTTPVGYVYAVSNLTLNSSIVNNSGAPGTAVSFVGPGAISVGATQTYTGNTFVLGGATIRPTTNDVLPDTAAFALDEGNLILDPGIKETIGWLRGSGASSIQLGTNSILRINQTADGNYYGMMNGSAGSTLVKEGGNALLIRNNMTNFQSEVLINRGTLRLVDQNGRMTLVPRFVVTNGTLWIDSQPGADNANQGDRVGQEADVYLNSGTIILGGSRNGSTTENIGDLIFQSGFSTVQLDASSTFNNSAYLNPNTFLRSNAATAFIRGDLLGGQNAATTNFFSRLAKDRTQANPSLVLTHPIAGSNTPSVGIVHWAYGQEDTAASQGLNANMGLVTYDRATNSAGAEHGFRLLRGNEYNTNNFDLGGNVWATTTGTLSIQSNTVVQGLVFQKGNTAGATVLQISNYVFNVSSGALLASGTNTGSNHEIRRTTVGGVSGALTFGNPSNGYEAVIHTARRLDVYAPIVDNVDGLGVTNKVTLTKSGTSELVMRADGGGLSTYSGDTYINAGTLRVEGTNQSSYTTASVIPKTTFVHLNNRDATFDLYASGQIVAGIDGWGRVTGSGNTNTGVAANPSDTYYNAFVVNYTNTSVIDRFDGWITDGSTGGRRFLDVVKQGAGVLEFTTINQTNTYRGDTIVEGGTLLMNGTHISLSNTTDYIVRSGATLGGTGLVRIGGTFSFDDGATLAPGNGPGTLTLDGNMTLNSNAVLSFQLNGTDTTVGGGINDLVAGVNDLYLDGILDVTALASFGGATTNDFWTLMTYDGILLTNLLDISLGSQSLLSGGQLFAIDDTVLGEIRLTIIPEPQSWALIILGLCVVGWLGRRPRKP